MPDAKVQAATSNWAPRFMAQGVDYNDFVRTTARIDIWDDWCREWCATGDQHAGLVAQSLSAGRLVSAGEAYLAAALCYHFGKFLFQDHPAEYWDASRKAVSAFGQGLRLLDLSAERVEIPFAGGTMVGLARKRVRRPISGRLQGLRISMPPLK